jgi:undecaprenyl phosphate-alpha-L-ara4N flippase subunit ArnE
LLILSAVGLTTIGQILQKLGAERHLKHAASWREAVRTLFCVEFILAIACLVGGTALWLVVLYRMEVSKAFPFISLGFVFVMLAARFYLHETVPWFRWLGMALIMAGIGQLAQT